MCGIFGYLASGDKVPDLQALTTLARRQQHRGPDYEGWYVQPKCTLIHHRLAIVDPAGGRQPILSKGGALAANGEIYNHKTLKATEGVFKEFPYSSGSDCEVLSAICGQPLESIGSHLLELEGMFAFIYWDIAEQRAIVARDPFGIIPLYYGKDENGDIYVASEMKTFPDTVDVQVFPPGHYAVIKDGQVQLTKWFHYRWTQKPDQYSDPSELFARLEAQVVSHLMTDVPYGVLLSGGLDSSIIAGLVCRHAKRRVESGESEEAWYPRVHSFSVGLEGSPDLAAAQLVATALGTVHHAKVFTVQEAIEALPLVIRHIETYDTTTIRASTPMVLLAQLVRVLGIKMVLSGEGADEEYAGYLYFAKAPNAEELRKETVNKICGLHQYDCLRANKSMMAHSVEARVPFLSTPFVNYSLELDPLLKMITEEQKMEKDLLRKAFSDIGLPESVVWRQKEQFSDGVGYDWISGVQAHAASLFPEFSAEDAALEFPVNPPRTPEEMLYRRLYEAEFPGEARAKLTPWGDSIACSTPAAIAWDESFRSRADASGRMLSHHVDAIK